MIVAFDNRGRATLTAHDRNWQLRRACWEDEWHLSDFPVV